MFDWADSPQGRPKFITKKSRPGLTMEEVLQHDWSLVDQYDVIIMMTFQCDLTRKVPGKVFSFVPNVDIDLERLVREAELVTAAIKTIHPATQVVWTVPVGPLFTGIARSAQMAKSWTLGQAEKQWRLLALLRQKKFMAFDLFQVMGGSTTTRVTYNRRYTLDGYHPTGKAAKAYCIAMMSFIRCRGVPARAPAPSNASPQLAVPPTEEPQRAPESAPNTVTTQRTGPTPAPLVERTVQVDDDSQMHVTVTNPPRKPGRAVRRRLRKLQTPTVDNRFHADGGRSEMQSLEDLSTLPREQPILPCPPNCPNSLQVTEETAAAPPVNMDHDMNNSEPQQTQYPNNTVTGTHYWPDPSQVTVPMEQPCNEHNEITHTGDQFAQLRINNPYTSPSFHPIHYTTPHTHHQTEAMVPASQPPLANLPIARRYSTPVPMATQHWTTPIPMALQYPNTPVPMAPQRQVTPVPMAPIPFQPQQHRPEQVQAAPPFGHSLMPERQVPPMQHCPEPAQGPPQTQMPHPMGVWVYHSFPPNVRQ